MDSFWAELLGEQDTWLRPVLGVAFFALVLYVALLRVPNTATISPQERQKHRRVTQLLLLIVVLFGMVVMGIHYIRM